MDEKQATSGQRIKKAVALRRRKKIVELVAAILAAVFLLLFLISAAVQKSGSFTIDLNYNDREIGVSLYDNRFFDSPTTRLEAESLKEAYDTTVSDVDGVADLDELDGSHNGEKYFAYTFYVRNTGTKTVDYTAAIDLLEKAKGADEALRVMLIADTVGYGESGNERRRTVYAKARSDGSGEPEPGTVPFSGETVVCAEEVTGFSPGDARKYTVVIFLEGNDPECVDDIAGGMARLGMRFDVTDVT